MPRRSNRFYAEALSRDSLAAATAAGKSPAVIATELSVAPQTVSEYLVRYGLAPAPRSTRTGTAPDEDVIAAYDRLGTVRGVADHFGLPYESVRRRLVAAGVMLRRSGRPAGGRTGADQLERIVAAYRSGATLTEISIDLGLAENTVRRRLRDAGVELRRRGPRPTG
jgi:hypothetical protein